MKNLFTLCLFIAVLCLAWKCRELSDREDAAQAKNEELKAEIEKLKSAAKPAGAHAGQPPAKTNWIDERNRNFQNTLSAGSTGGKGRQPPPSPTPPPKPGGR